MRLFTARSIALHFLAHLDLANGDPMRQIGQIAGDFSRGLDIDTLDPGIRRGIIEHRAVDRFTDTFPAVRQARQGFPSEWRRYAGIILDLYFDHLLANHWSEFSTVTLADTAPVIYQSLATHRQQWPLGMQRFTDYLIDSDMLMRLQHIEVMESGLTRITSRLSRPVDLLGSIEWLEENRDDYLNIMKSLYPALRERLQQPDIQLR
ncbi:ACP phosphodiesterase [Gammaproteobacteria bacterium]|nr:ACP phosphodiesterase [Gammaproteobacteria bacterium]